MLSRKQSRILKMLIEDKLSVLEIAQNIKITKNAVYKMIQRIGKNQSILNSSLSPDVPNSLIYKTPKENIHQKIRLHAQEFNAKTSKKTAKYNQLVGKRLIFEDSQIRVYSHSVEVYSGRSFFGFDADTAYSSSWVYWKLFFWKLERFLSCQIRPDKIKQVKAHYSEINNELAEKAYTEKQKISIKGQTDNKEWFLIDNSFNLREAETTHPAQSRADMQEVIAPIFNLIRTEPETLNMLIEGINKLFELARDQGELNKVFLDNLKAITQPPKDIYTKPPP